MDARGCACSRPGRLAGVGTVQRQLITLTRHCRQIPAQEAGSEIYEVEGALAGQCQVSGKGGVDSQASQLPAPGADGQ